jgi:hypothetical protein
MSSSIGQALRRVDGGEKVAGAAIVLAAAERTSVAERPAA